MSDIEISAFSDATTKTTIQANGFSLVVDEPPFFGGNNLAPSPVEYFLAAIAGCINAAGKWVARERGIVIHSIAIHVKGTIDSSRFFGKPTTKRTGFEKIKVTIEIDSPAGKDEVHQWLEETVSRCPVIDNATFPTHFDMEIKKVTAEK